jgi:hypothetical protein
LAVKATVPVYNQSGDFRPPPNSPLPQSWQLAAALNREEEQMKVEGYKRDPMPEVDIFEDRLKDLKAPEPFGVLTSEEVARVILASEGQGEEKIAKILEEVQALKKNWIACELAFVGIIQFGWDEEKGMTVRLSNIVEEVDGVKVNHD